MIHPGVQFKSVEGDALFTDADFGQIRPYYGVEAIAIHAEVARGVAQPDEAWLEGPAHADDGSPGVYVGTDAPRVTEGVNSFSMFTMFTTFTGHAL